MTLFLAILPTASALKGIFPKDLALIIAEYARSLDVETVGHICWETRKGEPMLHVIRHDPPIIPYKLMLVSEINELTPDPKPIHSSTLSCEIKLGHDKFTVYQISISANGHLMDKWSISRYEFYQFICSNNVRDYQESYFLPFIHTMHARLQCVIIHGDT